MLRKVYTYFILFCLSSTLTFAKEKTTIKGEFANTGNYKLLYLFKYFGSELIKIDSAKIAKGSFKFSGVYPRGFYKLGFSVNKALVMVIGNEVEMLITSDCNNFPASSKIIGSVENKLFGEFSAFNIQYATKIKELSQMTTQIEPIKYQDTTRYKEILISLRIKEDSLMNAQNNFFRDMYVNNSGTFMSKFAKMFYMTDTTKAINYFSEDEFNDEEYANGEMLVGKINSFFSNFVPKDPTSFVEGAVYLLSRPAKGSGLKQLYYQSIINLFIEVHLEQENVFRKQMAAEFPNSESVKRYLASLPKLGLQIGDKAPDIFLPDTSANFLKLSSLKGKVVLLDFWASWCGPCRRENPNVVRLYEKYKDKGLVILSVSLDEQKQNWINAIKKDKLNWLHVSDLRGWKSIAAAAYGIQSIPQMYVIDKDGNIIAKNLRGAELERFFEQQFK